MNEERAKKSFYTVIPQAIVNEYLRTRPHIETHKNPSKQARAQIAYWMQQIWSVGGRVVWIKRSEQRNGRDDVRMVRILGEKLSKKYEKDRGMQARLQEAFLGEFDGNSKQDEYDSICDRLIVSAAGKALRQKRHSVVRLKSGNVCR